MDISIIIVNWNTRDHLGNCLDSIVKTIGNIDYKIIVVDNASRDDSVGMVESRYPQVMLIQNEKNRGFGAANNQAMHVMAGRYALLLNSDTILTDNAVAELFSFMETHPDAAMACGQLLNADGSKQNSIASFPTLLTLAANMSLLEYLFPGKYPSKRYEHGNPIEIDSGIGACLLIRKKAIDDVGMFDERYFFFFEETDWAYGMRQAGWKVYHVPTARIYHLQGQSIGRNVHSRIEFYRSRYQFLKKWKQPSYFIIACAIIIIRLFVNCFFTFLGDILTLGLHRSLRDKWIVYFRLILWHFQGNKAQQNANLS